MTSATAMSRATTRGFGEYPGIDHNDRHLAENKSVRSIRSFGFSKPCPDAVIRRSINQEKSNRWPVSRGRLSNARTTAGRTGSASMTTHTIARET